MKDKVCFVIMGFGEKTDYSTGRTLDLDKTYKNIIRPAAERCGYKCVRSDEIHQSKVIDKSMYGLLLCADLVIADISTDNPNAIYELGMRHAIKPFYTVILKDEVEDIPFDLSHISIMRYSHLGKDIGVDEAKRCIDKLENIIKTIESKRENDSPFYEYIKSAKPPKMEKNELEELISQLASEHETLFAIVEQARKLKKDEKFEEASEYWKKASEKKPSEPYYIQQQALCKYKSEKPSKELALNEASIIISSLLREDDVNSKDPETLGIAGAIYKNMYLLNQDISILDKAIEYYGAGFNIRKDYYNGENYALCLNIKSSVIEDNDEKIYCKVQANKVRKEIIKILTSIDNLENRDDRRWIYATLANCYYAVNDKTNADLCEEKFKNEEKEGWELNTYLKNKKELFKVLGVKFDE